MRLLSGSTALLAALALTACGGSGSSSTTSSHGTSGPSASASGTSSATAPTSTAATTSASGFGPLSYEGIPIEQGPALGSAATTQTAPVDGVRCAPVEQLAYHIHAHLAVFVNGQLYSLPPGIGIPGSVAEPTNQGPVATGGQCFYWLHTHTSDGVIHIESPTQRIYTLGNFFDEWHQPLSATQVGDGHGRVTAFFNGKPWKRSLRAIPLLPHALIQLEIGRPTPVLVRVNWSGTNL